MRRIQHYIVYYSNAAFPPIPKLGFLSLNKAKRYVHEQNTKILGGDEWKIDIISTRLAPKKNFGGILRKDTGE